MDDTQTLLLTLAFGAENDASAVIQALANDLDSLGGHAGKVAESLGSLGPGAMAAGAGIAAIAAGLVAATDVASKWESALVTIANNTNISTRTMQAMGQAAVQISTETGASMETVAGGFEHAYNVTQDYNSAIAITKTATESAVSTGADAATVTNLLANALHEYGLDVSAAGTQTAQLAEVQANANQMMGAMHLATAESNTELGAFVDATAKAVGIAANLGVSYNDVFAATSALTKHGFPDVNQAGTQVTDMLTHMMNPSQGAKEARAARATASGDSGVAQAFTASSLASNGLVGTLDLLKRAMDDAGMTTAEEEAEMNKLVPALRGGLGAAALTGTAYGDMNKSLSDLQDTTKTAAITQDSFNRSLETTSGQWNVFKANAAAAAVTVGGPLNSALGGVLSTVNAITDGVGSMIGTFGAGFANASKDSGDFFGEFAQGAEAYVAQTNAMTESFNNFHAASKGALDLPSAAADMIAAGASTPPGIDLAGADASAAAVAAGQDQEAAAKAQDAARAQAIKDQQAAEKTAYTQSLADAKSFYADQAATAKAAAQATKDVQTAAAQQALDATKAEIAQEKTAYDDRAAQDIKDRQAQTQGALQELAKQNTAANVAAQAAKTAAEVQQAAVQRTADESDTAWKAQVAAIKDASTASENALHAALDAGLKHGVDTANQLYSAQVAAIDGEVKAREEGDAVIVHDREQASARTIAHIDAEKTAALAAIDAETRAYEAQEAAKVAAIDATSAAQVKALQDRLAAEKQANSERLDVNAMAAKYGAAAGTELSGYFAASDAVEADTQAALAAKAAGNQALADADTAAAAQQAAIAQGLADQLSAIDQTVSDQMVTYKIAADSAITADNVAAIQQQATDRKNSLAQQLAAEKQNESDKKASTTAYYDGLKAQEQQALADFKWSMSQNLQAFKDAEDQKKTADKAALDTTLANIALEQTAENTRHADAIAKIDAKAKADTAAIDLLAQQRKDAATAATAARNADDAAATAQRAAAYADAQQKINSTSQADIAALQAGQQQADTSFTARTAAAEAHFKDQQAQIGATYDADTAAITAAQQANTAALQVMTQDTTKYAASANGSLQGVLNTVNQINAAMGRQAQLQQTLQQQSGKGQQFGTGNAGGTGGGRGGPLTTAGPTLGDGHDTALGEAAFQRAAGYVGTNSGTYYRDGDTWCEQFAEDMTGLGNMGTTAANAWGNWGAKRLPGQIYPGPNLLYFSGPTSAGHVMVGDGDNGISVLDPKWGIVEESVGKFLGDNPGASFLGSVPLYGGGTDWHPGGLALVGDRGPELVDLPIGTRVYPNGRGPAGGGDTIININNPTLLNSRDMDELATKLGRVLVRQAGTGYSLAGLGAR